MSLNPDPPVRNIDVATDNRGRFATSEFDHWANNVGLNDEERFLVEEYLRPNGATLEAGTAGGRILLELKKRGFQSLRGFDIVEAMIDTARRRDPSGTIDFDCADATRLTYADQSFDQLIYLQQVLCFIEDESGRCSAMAEAFRVLRSGGVALFSLLAYEARARFSRYSPFLIYLGLRRWLGRSGRSIQLLPWFRTAERFNWGVLSDRGPYVYWYRAAEAFEQFRAAGFDVVGMGSKHQICSDGRLVGSIAGYGASPIDGMHYFVCRKP